MSDLVEKGSHLDRGARRSSSSKSPHSSRQSSEPLIFGRIDQVPPPNRRRAIMLKPSDETPIPLDFELGPLSEDEEARIAALKRAEVVRDAATPEEGEKPKKFRKMGVGKLILSTPDLYNPDRITARVLRPMRVELTSDWSWESGVAYVQAKFVNYIYPEREWATEKQMAEDREDFMKAHRDFFEPEGQRPNTEGTFILAYRTPNGKAQGHWVSSVYD